MGSCFFAAMQSRVCAVVLSFGAGAWGINSLRDENNGACFRLLTGDVVSCTIIHILVAFELTPSWARGGLLLCPPTSSP